MRDRHNISAATQWGIMAATGTAFSFSILLFFSFGWGAAHCDPAPQCEPDMNRQFILIELGVLVVSALVGWFVRNRARSDALRGKELAPPNWYVEVVGLILLVLALYGFQHGPLRRLGIFD